MKYIIFLTLMFSVNLINSQNNTVFVLLEQEDMDVVKIFNKNIHTKIKVLKQNQTSFKVPVENEIKSQPVEPPYHEFQSLKKTEIKNSIKGLSVHSLKDLRFNNDFMSKIYINNSIVVFIQKNKNKFTFWTTAPIDLE